MEIFSDLHIHSKYSRATSKDLNLENLEKWARVKGLDVIGTGDFTHPIWSKELKQNLREEDGILKTKNGFNFIAQTEISLIYTDNKKGRKIHLLVLAPNLETAEQITDYLKTKGRVDYDGRPIFNISCEDFVYNLMKISKDIEIIPAHAWTPYFGVFGSKTGYNSMEEAFKDQSKNIHAFETGMSSDPEMNWRISKLDKYNLVSFSDCHSFWPWRIGRESTIFELKELTYQNLINAIRKTDDKNKIKFTIETSPSYGKYHFDGHINCKFSCSPKENREKYKNICPICKKNMTVGVLNRVEELADREEGFIPKNSVPFKTILPLHEVISLVLNSPISSKKVWAIYNNLISQFKNEFEVLLNADITSISRASNEKIASYVIKNRNGKIKVNPGYDGEYGVPLLESEKQEKLF